MVLDTTRRPAAPVHARRAVALLWLALSPACLGPGVASELQDAGDNAAADAVDAGRERLDGGRSPVDGRTAPDSGGDRPLTDAGGLVADGGDHQAGGRGRDAGGEDGSARDAGGNPPDAGDDGGRERDAGRSAPDAGVEVPPGYVLVWSDEFDVPGPPDPTSWRFEGGFVRNHELQWYQAQNATVRDGLLVIEGRREHVVNPDYEAGSTDWKRSRQAAQYTAASLLTSGLRTWQYGRFELRARIPTDAGLWPAWWTLGQSGEWPSNGEIDIMEYYRGMLLANVACGTTTRWVAKWDASTTALSSLGADWPSSFHVWSMDWDETTITLFLDGAQLNSVPLSSMLNPDGTSPFRQPHYLILNLAIGGDNGGDPASTPFPVRYEIDYVRVFQRR